MANADNSVIIGKLKGCNEPAGWNLRQIFTECNQKNTWHLSVRKNAEEHQSFNSKKCHLEKISLFCLLPIAYCRLQILQLESTRTRHSLDIYSTPIRTDIRLEYDSNTTDIRLQYDRNTTQLLPSSDHVTPLTQLRYKSDTSHILPYNYSTPAYHV